MTENKPKQEIKPKLKKIYCVQYRTRHNDLECILIEASNPLEVWDSFGNGKDGRTITLITTL